MTKESAIMTKAPTHEALLVLLNKFGTLTLTQNEDGSWIADMGAVTLIHQLSPYDFDCKTVGVDKENALRSLYDYIRDKDAFLLFEGTQYWLDVSDVWCELT